jgi:cell division protein FtsB
VQEFLLQVQNDQKQITIDGLEAKVESLERENDVLHSQLSSMEKNSAAAAEEHAEEVCLCS